MLTRVPFVPPEGFVNLLMSGISPRIQVTPPTYPTLSDYQASFDVFQSRPSQSSEVGTSQIGTAVEAFDLRSPDLVDLVDVEHKICDFSSSNLDDVLNFNADDLRILQPFLND